MNALAIAERPPDATALAVTNDQLDLIRRTIAKDATPDELKLYLFDCARQGVHPLDKLIHFTKRSGKYTPVTSIDFMRIRAADTGEYAGSDDAVFSICQHCGGKEIGPSAATFAATVTVWRLVQGTRCGFTATARWAEYKPDANDFMWKKMPHTMLAKCAEALALRKGFPRQLAGLYAKEEMDQAERSERPAFVTVQAPDARAHVSPSTPSETIPSVPNGGDSGVNIQTGEEIPAGYHLISDYSFENGWHTITVNGLALNGGAMVLSTKTTCGDTARQAYYDQTPVRLDWKPKPKGRPGEGYLNRVYRWGAMPDSAPILDVPDPPF